MDEQSFGRGKKNKMCDILENNLTDFLSKEEGQSVLSNNTTGE